jgi:hypothetical protein
VWNVRAIAGDRAAPRWKRAAVVDASQRELLLFASVAPHRFSTDCRRIGRRSGRAGVRWDTAEKRGAAQLQSAAPAPVLS